MCRDSRSELSKFLGKRVRATGKLGKWTPSKRRDRNGNIIEVNVPVRNVSINDSDELSCDHMWITLQYTEELAKFLSKNVNKEVTFTAMTERYFRKDKTKSIGMVNIRQMTTVNNYKKLKEHKRKLSKEEKKTVLIKQKVFDGLDDKNIIWD